MIYEETPMYLAETTAPMTYRFGCILLDRDTENPPFEPARFFVVNVFAETNDEVLDVLGEEYPWCDIMFIDRMVSWKSDDEFVRAWEEWHSMNNGEPLREAPHGRH
jgi:hypothetical protein